MGTLTENEKRKIFERMHQKVGQFIAWYKTCRHSNGSQETSELNDESTFWEEQSLDQATPEFSMWFDPTK